MHRELHLRIEVLDSEAQPVEPHLPQPCQPLPTHGTRVDLDRILAVGIQLEMLPQELHEPRQLVIRKKRGRAAAQVQLAHGQALAATLGVQLHLAPEVVQIPHGPAVVTRDHLVAGAVVAHRLAEWHMHIQRDRRDAGRGMRGPLTQGLEVVSLAKTAGEPVGCGKRGIARAAHIKAAQQFGSDSSHGNSLQAPLSQPCPCPAAR